jgi:hypothetical protein
MTLRSTARPIPRHSGRTRQTLHVPTQDSDGTRATRRHATPRCAARPSSCTNKLGDRDCGSSTTARYTATWLLIELTAAVTLRSTARPAPRHSAQTKLSTPRYRTRMAPKQLGNTSHRGARLGPALARTDSETLLAAPRPMPGTTMTWLLTASMAAVTRRHTPRPVPWYPAQTRTVTPDGELRRHPCHSALRNAATHGSDRLYTHKLGRSFQPAHPRCARQRPSHHTFITPTDINTYADSPSPFRLRPPPCGPALWAPCRLRPHVLATTRAQASTCACTSSGPQTSTPRTGYSTEPQHAHHPPHRIASRHWASLSTLGSTPPPPLPLGGRPGPTSGGPKTPPPSSFYKRRASLHFARRSPGSILTSNGWLSSTGPGPAVT